MAFLISVILVSNFFLKFTKLTLTTNLTRTLATTNQYRICFTPIPFPPFVFKDEHKFVNDVMVKGNTLDSVVDSLSGILDN